MGLINAGYAITVLDNDDFKELVEQIDSYFYEDTPVEFIKLVQVDELVSDHLSNQFGFSTNFDVVRSGLVQVDEDAVIENYENEYDFVALDHTYDHRRFIVKEVG